jgi:hypothetical protein
MTGPLIIAAAPPAAVAGAVFIRWATGPLVLAFTLGRLHERMKRLRAVRR